MKIGIITIQKCDNFGADLQAYALGAKLRSLGYDAENVDYLFYKHPRHRKGPGEKPVLELSLVNRVKEVLFPIVDRLRKIRRKQLIGYSRNQALRSKRFAVWFEKNVKTGPEYRSVKSLYDNPPHYDVYMVGSDQVWNPRLGSNIKPYFLDFVPEGARCVSYASSFGVGQISNSVYLNYRSWLRKFSHIGVREASGVTIVKRMGLPAEVAQVVDPTLLLTADEWRVVARQPEEFCVQDSEHKAGQPYLLLYDLIACETTVMMAEKIAASKGLRVVRVDGGAYGPGEFLWLFAHADYVVTNSFHGSVFAIINEKPFATVIPKRMGNAARITSLLEAVGLSTRLVYAKSSETDSRVPALSGPVDYGPVADRIKSLRDESLQFLMRAVEGSAHAFAGGSGDSGPLVCMAAWNPDKDVRAQSTSGGVFSMLAERVIDTNGIVFGAAFDETFRAVRHIAVESRAELSALRGSKYVMSDAAPAVRHAVQELKSGRRVLFSGTPCQCAAMKVAARNCGGKLITVDFVCHGVPRPGVFEAYVDELERRYCSRLVRYEFRDKVSGWNFGHVRAEFENGRMYRTIAKLDPYYAGFVLNAFLSDPCYSCKYATIARQSDITLGDCWRVAVDHPQWDDDKGTSLVLANTEDGLRLLDEIGLEQFPGGKYEVSSAERQNGALVQPVSRPGLADRFDSEFTRTKSFARASVTYMTKSRQTRYWCTYWIKRLMWAYARKRR